MFAVFSFLWAMAMWSLYQVGPRSAVAQAESAETIIVTLQVSTSHPGLIVDARQVEASKVR